MLFFKIISAKGGLPFIFREDEINSVFLWMVVLIYENGKFFRVDVKDFKLNGEVFLFFYPQEFL